VPTAAPLAAQKSGLRCVALLDDRDASDERPTSRAYSGFVREHRCTDPDTLAETWAAVEADPGLAIQVDLTERQIRAGEIVAGFEVDDYVRWRLLEGLDDIGITLQSEGDITAFESRRPVFLPTTTPVA
jgi:hypothetical protein